MSTPYISKSTIGYVSVDDEDLFNAAQLHQTDDTPLLINPEHLIDSLEERIEDGGDPLDSGEIKLLELCKEAVKKDVYELSLY